MTPLCSTCGHPKGTHGRSHCRHITIALVPGFCDCKKFVKDDGVFISFSDKWLLWTLAGSDSENYYEVGIDQQLYAVLMGWA